jgi:hypothetical protein
MLSLDLAPYPTPLLRHVSLSQSFSVSPTRQSSLLTGEGEGGRRNQIIRRRQSLALYNLLTTLCMVCHFYIARGVDTFMHLPMSWGWILGPLFIAV